MTDPAVRAIIDRFTQRLDEVVERSASAIWEAVPSYVRAGEPTRSDVVEAVRGNVGALARVLSQGRDIRREELETIESVGAKRAEAGIPLDDVLHAYRTVSRVCWDILSDECRKHEGDALEAAISLAESLLRYTDQISTTVADAYAQAQRVIVREQEGARREFLADVLHGRDSSPEDLISRAHAFGYDLSISYVALVGLGPMGEHPRKEAAVAAAATAVTTDAVSDPIILQKAEQTIALLPVEAFADPSAAAQKMAVELGDGWRFGMGGPAPGLEGIRRAYLEAREALEIGLALELDGSIFDFEDLLLYRFLRLEPTLVTRFVEQILGPVLEYDSRRKGELIRTLEEYFERDASVKLAGAALFAHPHTVTYRLKQVERLTGLSLREPENKLKLQLALRAHRLYRSA